MHPDRAWPFLSAPQHPLLSAAWAVIVHGALGLLVVLPIVLRSRRRRLNAALAFAGGVAFDLDHVVAAASIRPRALEHLDGRPLTHSLLSVLLLAAVTLVLTREPLASWCVFAVLLSHLLFDAAGGGVRVLFPFERPSSLPWLACPVGVLILLLISTVLAGDRASMPDAHPVDQHARRELGGSVG